MARRAQKNIGLIGLGIIGSRVANTLRLKGYHVFVWNRSPRPVPNFVGAPAEVAEMCDHIQLFVSDDDALLEITKQIAPALAPRHIVIAHPTVAPYSMRAAADIVERRGARFVEAPFTGSKMAAEKGELVYYVAGDEIALRETRPTLEASGKEVIEIGRIGQATVIKIATNILTATTVQAAAEALALTKSSGVPLEKFLAAMKSNSSNSGTLSMKLPKMIDGDFEPHFSIKHMLKDMQLASRAGLSNHLELSVTTATRDRLLEQAQRGFGDEDYAALARKYFHEARPATGEEVNLELFEQPVEKTFVPISIPEPMAAPMNLDAPETQPEALDTSLSPVLAQDQPPENQAEPGTESASFPAPLPDEAAPPKENSESHQLIDLAPETIEAPADETAVQARRGLFDRLLRRSDET
ncbi:MAG TPA: NAD(P)-dependent oxidoreductase [Chthoniobacterales bacterium]|nr:NAD(P)-dependent oxidoreductase [Chthoniobacterales bacterium]